MRYTMRLVLIVLTAMLLAACSKPTLDTSSEVALKESVHEIMADLSPEDKKRFKKTLTGIYMLGAFAALGGDMSKKEVMAKLNAKLHGKTAEEVFIMADELQKQPSK